MTLTIELPDVLAEQAADAGMSPAEMGRYAEAGAVTALATALGIGRKTPESALALLEGVDPEGWQIDMAAAERGLADADAGRTVSIEEASAHADAALDTFIQRRQRERTVETPGTGA